MIKSPQRNDARVIVKVALPKFLVKAGWEVVLENPGAAAFALKAGEAKSVVLRLKPGKTFKPKDVKTAKDKTIRLEAYADGILVGGMSYQLDPNLKEPAK